MKSLGISKVSVYGHSYGTLVATIFTHFFPQYVTGTVLEGVIFDGTNNLWISHHRIHILQRFFNALSEEIQQTILNLNTDPRLPPDWFSRLAQKRMYSANFKSTLLEELRNLQSTDPTIFDLALQKITQSIDESFAVTENSFFSAFFFHHIGCQELSMTQAYWSAEFKNKTLVPTEKNWKSTCDQIPGIDPTQTYRSVQYPITTPVTYIQGTMDGATDATSAIKHYKHVARGQAQIFLVVGEGHAPLNKCARSIENINLDPQSCPQRELILGLFSQALRGELVDQSTKTSLKATWKYAQKK